jgi:hypothetical protein
LVLFRNLWQTWLNFLEKPFSPEDLARRVRKMTFNYKGVLKGDEIGLTFTTEMEGGPGMGAAPPQSFTVKRVE